MLRLEIGSGTLTRDDGTRTTLVPKVAALLHALATRHGQLVAHDTLFEAVWPDVAVEDNNLAKLVFFLRKELGADAIETIPRRGYRLRVPIALEDPPAAIPDDAYALYLEGRYLWNRRPGDVVWRALDAFRAAVARAPRFAAAWAGIADVYATLGSWEAGVLPHAEAHARAWEHVTAALAIDPDHVEALTTRAYTQLHYAWQRHEALACFDDVIARDPRHATAHHWRSHALLAIGDPVASLAASRRALALDPMNLLYHVHLAFHHLLAGAPDDAAETCRRVIAMDPHFHWGHYFASWAAAERGDGEGALAAARIAYASSNEDLVMRAAVARAEALVGERASALAHAAALASHGRYDYEVALVYLALGEHDPALAALGRAEASRSGWITYAAIDPRLATLRADPRFPRGAPLALDA